MKSNEVYVYFSLSDFECNPQEITERLGIIPTKSWRKDDIDKYQRQRKSSRWSLYSRLEKTKELEDHIKDVLAQLDEKAHDFYSLTNKFDGHMQLVGYFHQYYPGFYLDSWIIERLGYYKLSLDCDFYYLYSEKREDTY